MAKSLVHDKVSTQEYRRINVYAFMNNSERMSCLLL